MVKLNKIYTRTGDDGSTALVSGPRRNKNDIRITAYGGVDEANSFVGQARIHVHNMARLDAILARVQNDLFDLGSDLATPGPDEKRDYPALRISSAQTDWLETQIDMINADLAPLNSFVLPAGTPLAAALHVARTVVRRVERDTVALMASESDTNPSALTYLNRLSDLLFVLARHANKNGKSDVLWVPGKYTGNL